jgi:hypothetical protein
MPMTKEQMPEGLDHAPQYVRDAWNSMSEQDKRESRLLGIVKMAYEPDNVQIIEERNFPNGKRPN